MKLKRASYRDGVAWIAAKYNLPSVDLQPALAVDATRLLASLFGRDEQLVALDILRAQRKDSIEVEKSADSDDFDWNDDENEGE